MTPLTLSGVFDSGVFKTGWFVVGTYGSQGNLAMAVIPTFVGVTISGMNPKLHQ